MFDTWFFKGTGSIIRSGQSPCKLMPNFWAYISGIKLTSNLQLEFKQKKERESCLNYILIFDYIFWISGGT